MKKVLVLLMILSLTIITWCWKDQEETSLGNTSEWEVSFTTESEEWNTSLEESENEAYQKVIEEKWTLKDATPEELDAIVQENIDKINTASSDYPFFKQWTIFPWDMLAIKEAGWMEVTNGQIYLVWLWEKYSGFTSLLWEEEKDLSFYKDTLEFAFYYTEMSKEEILSAIKSEIWVYEIIFSDESFVELELKKEWVTYSIQIQLPNTDNTQRDELDFILSVMSKNKVIISAFEE